MLKTLIHISTIKTVSRHKQHILILNDFSKDSNSLTLNHHVYLKTMKLFLKNIFGRFNLYKTNASSSYLIIVELEDG